MRRKSFDSEVLDARGVAAMLGIAVETVYLWAQSGRLPGQKLGKLWRFSRTAIMAALAQKPKRQARRSPARPGARADLPAPVAVDSPGSTSGPDADAARA